MFSLLSSCLMWLPVIIVLFNVYTLSLDFRRALSPISWFSDTLSEYLITSTAWKWLWGIYRSQHEACISERISSDTVCVSLVPGWGRVMLGVRSVTVNTRPLSPGSGSGTMTPATRSLAPSLSVFQNVRKISFMVWHKAQNTIFWTVNNHLYDCEVWR